MRVIRFLLCAASLLVVLVSIPGRALADPGPGGSLFLPLVSKPAIPAIPAPVLKWAYGGCYASWCETGWYSSPAAVDVNGDGTAEVIAAAYSAWALNGTTGALVWRAGNTSNRAWPGIAIADLERDGFNEIVVARSGPWVTAYRLDGSVKWERQPSGAGGEYRGLLVADLDNNASSREVVVTRAYGSATNTWVLNSSGTTLPGWPRQDAGSSTGYAWGVYNNNAAAGNLIGSAALELVVPSDVHYINAYARDGSALPASPSVYPGKTWGRVGVWESLTTELRGWGECDGVRPESYRANFADGPAVITDVNGDGVNEVIVTGNMYNCIDGYPSQYMALFLFNADRTRFVQDGFDWSQNPLDTGAPIAEDYNVIESVSPSPVAADLDGDGLKEILYASYDGRLHAFWLDKTEHEGWPFSVYHPAEGFYRFASEPAVADLNNDGKAEVIFASWTQKGSGAWGKLHILAWDGSPLFEVTLPAPRSGGVTWNGAMAAPTLANIDADPDLEVILNTSSAGTVVYDLPGSTGARVLWGTGRGNYGRTGSP